MSVRVLNPAAPEPEESLSPPDVAHLPGLSSRKPSVAVLLLDEAHDDPETMTAVGAAFDVVLLVADARTAASVLTELAAEPAGNDLPAGERDEAFRDAGFSGEAFRDAGFSGGMSNGKSDAVESGVHAVPRVTEAHTDEQLVVDPRRQVATWGEQALPLSRHERDILGCLLSDRGRVWSYESLHEGVWGGNYLGDPSLLHSALKRLRRKLRHAGVPYSIDAVRGIGFRLAAL